MNKSEILLLCLVVVSIFLVWRSVNQKNKKQLSAKVQPRSELLTAGESPDCIPPKGMSITIIIQGEIFRTLADGKSTLQTLQESLLWNNRNYIERKTKAPVLHVLENLFPTNKPFMWRLSFKHHI